MCLEANSVPDGGGHSDRSWQCEQEGGGMKQTN